MPTRIPAVLIMVIAAIAGPGRALGAAGSLAPVGLRCEYQENPLGIDAAQPRLSWRLESKVRADAQSAYQVLAASTTELLKKDTGDLWDSGRVAGNQSVGVVYRGKPLTASQTVFWKVRVWDKDGRISRWSEPATWEMGLLAAADWQAQWINDGKANPTNDADFYREDPAPLFRKAFEIPKSVRRARLYVCGLGYYEASLNGGRVGDHVLDPGWTRYSERALYSTYDVTAQLRRGSNCLGVALGNGWYNPLPLRMWGHRNIRQEMPVGRPRFIARLEVEFTDGTRTSVVSDPSWRVGEGAIRFDSIYLGEIYDARLDAGPWDRAGFDDSDWRTPSVASEPIGPLRAQAQPPIRVTATLDPVKLTEPSPGVFIYDFGTNFGGWVEFGLTAPAGTRVVFRYGELLNSDGTLNPMTSVAGQIKGNRKDADGREVSVGGPGAPPVAWQTDTYIAKGGGKEFYTPRFTFHSFRYVEVTGLPSKPWICQIKGLRLQSDVPPVGSFECSSDLFNRIQAMCGNTFLSGIFSVQSDCPHRERFGYGGDIAATSEAFMMNYDMAGFYAKTVRDWAESARPDGMLTDTAPFVGIQYCGVGWATAHPLVLRQLYQYYGDRALVEEQYATAKRWLDLVTAANPGFIVSKGLHDHETLAPAPTPVMVTPLYADSVRLVGELAEILGRDKEAQQYRKLLADIRETYAKKFVDPATGRVGPGTQGSQAFGLRLDMVPADQRRAALDVLLDDIQGKQSGHLATGIFGTKFMLTELSREGQAGVAYTIASQTNFPGWGYMLANDATTLWEHWKGSDNTFSHNHPMFGSVSEWFYQWLGGIQPAPDAVAFDRIVIRPQPVGDLTWVRCHYDSIRGPIATRWDRKGTRLTLAIEIPPNTTATVHVPCEAADAVTEGGKPAARAAGVRLLEARSGEAVFEVGSGRYRFETTLPDRR